MNKTSSRFTYISFIALFIIIAPILIFYVLGYRYNWTNRNIEKNGALYIKSYPSGAEIYIDDRKIKPKTPTQVVEISSGKYEVTVKKDKYLPWTKKLEIYSGNTTFAEDIVLFLENQEKTPLSTGSKHWIINKQKSQYAHLDPENNIYVTNIEQGKTLLVFKFDQNYELTDWSPNNAEILLRLAEKYFIFNLDQKKIQATSITEADKILWDNNDANLIWYQKNSRLYRHYRSTLASDDLSIDSSIAIVDFDLTGDYLLTLANTDKGHQFQKIKKINLNLTDSIDNLNQGSLKAWQADDELVIFGLGSGLYVKKIDQDPIIIPHTIADIHDERILYTNGYETSLYNFKKDWSALIDRSSQIVSDVLWHPNGSYFLSESNDQTYITEIDGRDKRNIFSLLENPLKKLYLFNKKGDRLFILTPEENFYLTIQE